MSHFIEDLKKHIEEQIKNISPIETHSVSNYEAILQNGKKIGHTSAYISILEWIDSYEP